MPRITVKMSWPRRDTGRYGGGPRRVLSAMGKRRTWPTWPTNGPLKKRQVGHRKAMSALAKRCFRHKMDKNPRKPFQGIRGGASRRSLRARRGRHSRQPWTLRVHPSLRSGPLLRGQGWYCLPAAPVPLSACPRSARVPCARTPCGASCSEASGPASIPVPELTGREKSDKMTYLPSVQTRPVENRAQRRKKGKQ
jgi:hypothetical protein